AALRAWAASNRKGSWPPDTCPVCETPLAGQMDPVLGVGIGEAMAEVDRQQAASHVDAEYWDRDVCARLDKELPASVRRLADRNPARPADALRQAFTDGLIRSAILTGHLAGLAGRLKESVAPAVAGFPPPVTVRVASLPDEVAERICARRLAAVAAAVGDAEWVRSAEAEVAALRSLIEAPSGDSWPAFNLFRALADIERILEAHRPLKTARDAAKALRGLKDDWDVICRKIHRARSAIDAVTPLDGLVGLVDTQVGTLMCDLHERTDTLCARVYERTNTAGPDLDRVDVVDGALKRRARFDDMVGDGGEVLNASRDRAWLFAFAIALLERIRERDGGLSLLLLDDPQALFDEANQRTLATGLGTLPTEGTRPVIVTFNHHFAAALSRNAAHGAVASFEIVPRAKRGLRATVRPLATELERAQQAWRREDQDLRCVAAYCAEARVYLERALCDLLWSSRIAVHGGESLQPLFDKLASLAKRGAPYDKDCFRSLIGHPAWRDDKVKQAINWSHHHARVDLKPPHAEHLDEHLDALIGLIEACQKALDQVMAAGRAPAVETDAVLPARAFAQIFIPVQGALAARERVSVDEASAPEPTDPLVIDPERHALFVAGSGLTWLRPICEAGDVLVVEREPGIGNALSVAWDGHKAFAGWLRRSSRSGAMLLEGNPDHHFLLDIDPGLYTIHPIAGILFKAAADQGGVIGPYDAPPLMARLKAAVPIVTGRSAEPVLRVGNAALIGAPLDGWPAERDAVAVRLSNGEQVLKRLGRRLDSKGHVR
ncbi:MAG: hypothetical protein K2X54_00100, partial [Methylobacterium organophilum]|nr:hypothetical protein [Methylobacterium organophilum]